MGKISDLSSSLRSPNFSQNSRNVSILSIFWICFLLTVFKVLAVSNVLRKSAMFVISSGTRVPAINCTVLTVNRKEELCLSHQSVYSRYSSFSAFVCFFALFLTLSSSARLSFLVLSVLPDLGDRITVVKDMLRKHKWVCTRWKNRCE